MRELTKKEIKRILAELPEKNRSATEKKFAKLAKTRLAEINAEAKTDKARGKLNALADKPRTAKITGVASLDTAAEKLNAFINKPRTINFMTRLSGPAASGSANVGASSRSSGGTEQPSDSAGRANVTVNLDGRVVSAVLSDRMNRKTREVWV